MGVAYADQRKYARAIAAYESALAINPDDAMVYTSLGHAYFEQQQYAEAIAAYKKATTLDPKGEAGLEAMKGLKEMEKQ